MLVRRSVIDDVVGINLRSTSSVRKFVVVCKRAFVMNADACLTAIMADVVS